jgi:hypothetical protein
VVSRDDALVLFLVLKDQLALLNIPAGMRAEAMLGIIDNLEAARLFLSAHSELGCCGTEI